MKALILAAGFGERLRPFTKNIPKPLFTLGGRPLLDIIISKLAQAGCQAIMINTHHLHQKIDSFLSEKKYPIPVTTCHEPEILGTGGAIKNIFDFWDDDPFMVINSDIVTDIDLKKVYEFHLSHDHPVTLVLHDDKEFNTVSVNHSGHVIDFNSDLPLNPLLFSWSDPFKHIKPEKTGRFTFTGIQVIDPEVLDYISENTFSSSIDIYRRLIAKNKKICAFFSEKNYWRDIGSPDRYRRVVFENMAPQAFKQAFPGWSEKRIVRFVLKGDGSDRSWFRLTDGRDSLLMADHGIKKHGSTTEIDAFVAIGRHLYDKGMPVPKIFLYDIFAGLVFMEDLGDVNLQSVILNAQGTDTIVSYYTSAIRLLGKLSVSGAVGFDPAWTYQTPAYDKGMILEKECRYFVEAFLNGYIGMNIYFGDLEDEFTSLADKALEFSVKGFMHRDLQSRNIMVKNHRFYLIDFQGSRLGPIQYDLASLLIDPYVELSCALREELLDFGVETLSSVIGTDPIDFLSCYKYCAITRNLQILGAFGYLSRIKKKTYFEKYIPHAIKTLMQHLAALETTQFPNLTRITNELFEYIRASK